MIYQFKFPLSDVITKKFILSNIELEVEDKNLPENGDLAKSGINDKLYQASWKGIPCSNLRTQANSCQPQYIGC